MRSGFTAAGLAHLLAVSGLHVTLLAGVLGKLLGWCRVPRRAHVWVVAPILIFYSYLCGWQYAVLRAVIMYLVYAFAKNRLRPLDRLSVLSLAAVVILLLFPYALRSVSFLLSFSCVLGIDLWYDVIYQRIPSRAVAIYLAVTLGSFPFLVYYFGSIPLFGLVTNVVLMPLLIVAFYLGVFAVGTFVCGAVLWIAKPLLNFVHWVTQAIGALPWANLTIHHNLLGILVFLLGSLILSRFVFLRRKVKIGAAVALFGCYLLLIVL